MLNRNTEEKLFRNKENKLLLKLKCPLIMITEEIAVKFKTCQDKSSKTRTPAWEPRLYAILLEGPACQVALRLTIYLKC